MEQWIGEGMFTQGLHFGFPVGHPHRPSGDVHGQDRWRPLLSHSFIASGRWWCKRWGMKAALLLALVLGVGCGGGNEEAAPKTQAKVEAAPKTEPKDEAKKLEQPEANTKKDEAEGRVSASSNPNNVKIEKAIRKKINKPTGELTKADLEKVTRLSLKNNQLTDVKGLEKLTQLKHLDLEDNQLTDVKGLEDLTQLTFLDLDNNQLTDVKGLENLTQLEELKLGENKLTSVKGLEKLTQLTTLYLDDNQLADVKGLEKLTQLTELILVRNQLTDVKGLEKLNQLKALVLIDNKLTDVKGLKKLTQLAELHLQNNRLIKAQIAELQKALPKCEILSNPPLTNEESAKVIEAAIRKKINKPTRKLTKADLEKVILLDLRENQLADVKGLEKLTQLTELNLEDNQLTDVKGLEKLTQLKELVLSENQLTDVKGLEKLTHLEDLDLEDNPDLTKAQIDELQKALPKCKIQSNPTK
jgi:internalin A